MAKRTRQSKTRIGWLANGPGTWRPYYGKTSLQREASLRFCGELYASDYRYLGRCAFSCNCGGRHWLDGYVPLSGRTFYQRARGASKRAKMQRAVHDEQHRALYQFLASRPPRVRHRNVNREAKGYSRR